MAIVAVGCRGSDGAIVDGAPGASCDEAPATCGQASSSCCASSLVPHGTFYRNRDVSTDNRYTDMTHPASVNDFRLDTFEVTVGRFRRFASAGMGTQQNPPPSDAGARIFEGVANQGGWDPGWTTSLTADARALATALHCDAAFETWTDTPGANENLPINCITGYEAMAFCLWDGGFLPTETEWNFAASGGDEQRAYPWSNPASSLAVDCSHANYYPGMPCVSAPIGAVSRVGSVSAGDGRWGQADLGGNVWEWTLDWYLASQPSTCDDCANLTPASSRVIRGGAFAYGESYLRAANRNVGAGPTARQGFVGFRCARGP